MSKLRNFAFALLILIFAVLMCVIFGLNERMGIGRVPFPALFWLAGVFFVLSIVEIVLTAKLRETKLKKIFFILTGVSAACIPVFAVLHNVVYGLFFAGKDGDEAVFFILALLVCPILFVVGLLGSITALIASKLTKRNFAA